MSIDIGRINSWIPNTVDPSIGKKPRNICLGYPLKPILPGDTNLNGRLKMLNKEMTASIISKTSLCDQLALMEPHFDATTSKSKFNGIHKIQILAQRFLIMVCIPS